MTGTQDPSASWRGGARLLLEDLALIAGKLNEIATVWRRATAYLPELPLMLPMQLWDTARELAADIRGVADTGPLQPP